MGEELELGQLFIKSGDGDYVPFEGIKPMDIWVGDDMDLETYNSLPQEGTITFQTVQTHKQNREIAKWIKTTRNHYRRQIRTMHRQKERVRRWGLKHGIRLKLEV